MPRYQRIALAIFGGERVARYPIQHEVKYRGQQFDVGVASGTVGNGSLAQNTPSLAAVRLLV
jgi:hypothetical protein